MRAILKQQLKHSSGRQDAHVRFQARSGSFSDSSVSTCQSKRRSKTKSSYTQKKTRRYSSDRSERRRKKSRNRHASDATLSTDSCSLSKSCASHDTDENSESKLEDIGIVVRASDLSDYSETLSLDSDEEEEFQEFVKKYDNDKQSGLFGLCYFVDDESEVNSLDASNLPGAVSTAFSEESSSIAEKVEVPQSSCMMKVCFCGDDSESLDGSYGGLREGEILFAESTTTWTSSEFTSRQATVSFDTKDMDTVDDTVEGNEKTSALSRLFCFPDSGNDSEDEGHIFPQDTEEDHIEESRSIVEGSEEDSEEDQTSRSDYGDETEETEPETESEESSRHERRDQKTKSERSKSDGTQDYENEDAESRDEQGIQKTKSRDTDCNNKKVYVLGDNVNVSAVTEVTTDDGGTAFIVFLKSQSHSEDEEERDESQESVTAKTKASFGNGTAENETAIAVVDDALCIVTEMPKLVLDDDVNKYLAYLTPQCVTSNQQGPAKRKIPRLIRAHQEGTDIELTLAKSASSDKGDKTTSDLGQYVRKTRDGVQYLFCMRVEDLDHVLVNEETREISDHPFDEQIDVANGSLTRKKQTDGSVPTKYDPEDPESFHSAVTFEDASYPVEATAQNPETLDWASVSRPTAVENSAKIKKAPEDPVENWDYGLGACIHKELSERRREERRYRESSKLLAKTKDARYYCERPKPTGNSLMAAYQEVRHRADPKQDQRTEKHQSQGSKHEHDESTEQYSPRGSNALVAAYREVRQGEQGGRGISSYSMNDDELRSERDTSRGGSNRGRRSSSIAYLDARQTSDQEERSNYHSAKSKRQMAEDQRSRSGRNSHKSKSGRNSSSSAESLGVSKFLAYLDPNKPQQDDAGGPSDDEAVWGGIMDGISQAISESSSDAAVVADVDETDDDNTIERPTTNEMITQFRNERDALGLARASSIATEMRGISLWDAVKSTSGVVADGDETDDDYTIERQTTNEMIIQFPNEHDGLGLARASSIATEMRGVTPWDAVKSTSGVSPNFEVGGVLRASKEDSSLAEDDSLISYEEIERLLLANLEDDDSTSVDSEAESLRSDYNPIETAVNYVIEKARLEVRDSSSGEGDEFFDARSDISVD